MNSRINREQLLLQIRNNPALVLVEALPEKYFKDWHLPRARHLPHDQVLALAAQVLPDKTAAIVVYCASATCQNSHIAANTLRQLGYPNVAVYGGGKQDWSEAQLPVETAAVAA